MRTHRAACLTSGFWAGRFRVYTSPSVTMATKSTSHSLAGCRWSLVRHHPYLCRVSYTSTTCVQLPILARVGCTATTTQGGKTSGLCPQVLSAPRNRVWVESRVCTSSVLSDEFQKPLPANHLGRLFLFYILFFNWLRILFFAKFVTTISSQSGLGYFRLLLIKISITSPDFKGVSKAAICSFILAPMH